MIMSSGRFSGGGGGGGSHRDVVFNAKLVADPKNAQVLSGMGKQIEDLQKKYANMQVGVGGAGPSGRAGSGRGGGGDPYAAYNRQRNQEMREQEQHQKRVTQQQEQARRRQEADYNRQRNQERREQEQYRQRQAFYDKIRFDDGDPRQRSSLDRLAAMERGGQSVKSVSMRDRARDMALFRREVKDSMEGLIGLTRAFVLFGVSSEENMAKAVRSLAMFEGAVAGYKGGMKLAGGLGGLLGRGAPRLGMAAGAGTTGLGAAGIAAGVGVLGGGMAIYDQLQYMRTGQIGAYSQGYANTATSAARFMQRNRMPGMGVGSVGLIGVGLEAAGFGDAARAEDRYARGSQAQVSGMGYQLKESQQRLAIEQQILSLMDREVAKQKDATAAANNRMQGAAFAYQGLSGMDQRAVGRLRDKFLKDPSKVDSRRLQNLMPFVGQAEQEQIAREMEKRSGGYFAGGGFSREREAKLNARGEGARISQQLEMQREFVIQLKTEDEERFKGFEQALKNALEVADEAAQERLQKIADEVMELRRQMGQQALNRNAATSASYGFGS